MRIARGPGDLAFAGLTALALSIGWGIRGNFGHEAGAMIAGALSAITVVLIAHRDDWHRRAAFFAMFGALGWSFGGSMSYMQVVAYTHSGHAPSVLYGFACLFLIGFLWAAPGGAGTALPAVLDRETLTGLIPPIAAVLAAWFLEESFLEPLLVARGFNLNWFDTDWLGALVAIGAALTYAMARRRLDEGTVLILFLAIGWWIGFLTLTVGLGLRMTPPRGDNWAGMAGLVGGLFAWCRWTRRPAIARAAWIAGIGGGISFAGACMLKLVEVTSGLETNWHSVMEQTTGLIHGFGIAAAMGALVRHTPEVLDEPPVRRWTEVFAVGFVLLGIPYLNLRKNPAKWVELKAMPAEMFGIATPTWFDIAFLLLTVAVLVPLIRHLRRPLPLIPPSPLGRGQLLLLVFLWMMVAGNFERALPGFAPQRLVTEGVIWANAAILTLGVLAMAATGPARWVVAIDRDSTRPPRLTARAVAAGLIVAAAAILLDFAVVRALYGDRFAGHAGLHIRFGPDATPGRSDAPR